MGPEPVAPTTGRSPSGGQIALIVALMSILGPFSIDAYLPSFPEVEAEFGISHLRMQQTLSAYLWAFAAMTLLYGPLADAFGRRRVVLWTLFLYALSSAGCALATDIEQLTVLRMAQGLTASGGMVIGRAAVRDVFAGPRAQRVLSHVMLMFALAPAVAPIIGGYLHELAGWRAVFWFLAALGLFVWGAVALRFPETLAPSRRQSFHPTAVLGFYFTAVSNPGFLVLVAAISLMFGGVFLYIAGAPALIYRHLGYGASDFGILFVPWVAGMMLGAWLSARLAGRNTGRQTIRIGFILTGVAAIANLLQSWLLPAHPVGIILPVSLYAVGLALAMPSLSLLALDHLPHNRGTASAFQGFAQTAFNGAVAAALVPWLAVSLRGLALGMLVLNALALSLWAVLRGTERIGAP